MSSKPRVPTKAEYDNLYHETAENVRIPKVLIPINRNMLLVVSKKSLYITHICMNPLRNDGTDFIFEPHCPTCDSMVTCLDNSIIFCSKCEEILTFDKLKRVDLGKGDKADYDKIFRDGK